MHIKRTCLFVLDKEIGKPDARLRCRIKWNNNTVSFTVGCRIDLDNWNTETQRCRINTTNGKKKISASIINRKIQDFDTCINNAFASFEQQQATPSLDEFRTAFNSQSNRLASEVKIFISDVLFRFMCEESRAKQWQNGTYKKYDSFCKRLVAYDDKLTFLKLENKGLVDYMYYLINTKNYVNTTIVKEFQLLTHFLNWAAANNYSVPKSYLSFKPKLKIPTKTVVFLTWEELIRMNEYIFTAEQSSLERVRDVFAFCCFTGLRYSDVFNLKKGNIKACKIEITTMKTADRLIIELNKYSVAILEKYNNIQFANDKVLPVISNQKMNDALKVIGEICEIDELITVTSFSGNERIEYTIPKRELLSTHAGRRTFICNAISLGISPQVIMKWTGHSDYKSMKPYIDVADSIKSEAMSLFDKK